jgi:hypothetical protein
MTSRRTKRAVRYSRVFMFLLAASMAGPPAAAEAGNQPSVALLGVQFQNDNEGLEPTSDAERARLERTEKEFVEHLAASGRYRIIPVPDDVRANIAAGHRQSVSAAAVNSISASS